MLFSKSLNDQLLLNFQAVFLGIILPMFQHTFTFPDSTIETLEKCMKYFLTFQKADFRGLHEITRLQSYGKAVGLLSAAYS